MRARTNAGFVDGLIRANSGRNPEQLRRKLEAMQETALGFFRGSCSLFFDDLQREGRRTHEPLVWSCGDLHLANFGSYRAGNGLVYFDIADFDEGLLAPISFDLVRVAASFVVAAHDAKLPGKAGASFVATAVDAYCAAIATQTPYWIERSTARGVVRRLLRKVKQRTTEKLVASRTQKRKSGKRKIRCDDNHALKADAEERMLARRILHRAGRADTGLRRFRIVEVANRIAGLASLGLPRFVVLVEDRATGKERLIDIKLAQRSAIRKYSPARQPGSMSDAHRVVAVQLMMQAAPPALLVPLEEGSASYVVRELEPTADKIALKDLGTDRDAWRSLAETLGAVTAWAHLRGAGRRGTASIEEVAAHCTAAWSERVKKAVQRSARSSIARWRVFRDAKIPERAIDARSP